MERLEIKITTSKRKNIWDGINKLYTEKKKINKLEGTATETIQNEIYREKRLKTLTEYPLTVGWRQAAKYACNQSLQNARRRKYLEQ